MNLAEYARFDATGLAALVARKEVAPKELALAARRAMDAVDRDVRAVVETYPDRIEGLDERRLGKGPFRGVPFLIKDVFGHNRGRKIEMGSRLCRGMTVETQSHLADMFEAAGLNIIGRSAAPEYSMSSTTETALYGHTSNPWRKGWSAGGSSGGAQAAVTSGIVPLAHGSDIGGSIRIPASWCGGVGLKPSRGRVSIGPTADEVGFGMSANLVQAKTVRDVAAILDCVSIPQVGDPFVIPKPRERYATLAGKAPPKLRIALVLEPLFGVPVDSEVKAAVEATAHRLADMGHEVEPVAADMGGPALAEKLLAFWFFAFDARLDGYAARSGRTPGPDTLEPVIFMLYEWSKSVTPAQFMASVAALNTARRKLGRAFEKHDVWLSPTTARVAEPFGRYHLSKPGVTIENICQELFLATTQFCVPHNIMGTPAISLPLSMHSSGVPIGVQIAARPAAEHVVLQLATALEQATPWAGRVPPLHVSRAEHA
jgi:amidase